MSLRDSLRRLRPRAFAGPVALAVALALAWSIVANTAADNLAVADPEAALAWRAETAPALVALARQRLSDGLSEEEAADIGGLAKRAMVAAPLEEHALGILGVLADMYGGQEQTGHLMALAAERSRRSGFVEVWSFFHEARQGNFGAALEHADALLRTSPNLQHEIAPTLVAFAIDDEAKDAVVGALAENPPWRGWYLRELAKQTDDPGIAFAVLSDLRESAYPPTDAELRSYLENLVRTEQFAQAYLTWITFLPEEQRQSIPFAYNGDFEYPLSGLPFDWTIERVTGASTEIVETGKDDVGHAVHIEFANRRVPYRHLRKLLMLPPGSYELTSLAKAQQLENDRGLVWQVVCAEADKQQLGETEPVRGTADWHRVSMRFVVPQVHCRAQWLVLVLAARAALEQEVGGAVWFDDMRVVRVGTGDEELSEARD